MTTNRRDGLRDIQECANFFGKSIEWIRFHESSGHFKYEDGEPIYPVRRLTPTGVLGARLYSLDMIEAMARSLRRKHKLNKYQEERVLNVVEAFRKVQNQ